MADGIVGPQTARIMDRRLASVDRGDVDRDGNGDGGC